MAHHGGLSRTHHAECLIVGAGVIGLSLAYELSRRGLRVAICDRGQLGQEASWAGAGILPPANRRTAKHALDELRGLSYELHKDWAARLLSETENDNGYQRCGGLYLARSPGETAALHGWAGLLREEEINVTTLSAKQLADVEPALASDSHSQPIAAALLLTDEAQLRNPRHLTALKAACQVLGVEFLPDAEVTDIVISNGRVSGVVTPRGTFTANQFCFTAGAWTQRLLAKVQVATGIMPIRGQIVLFHCSERPFQRIINEGPRYLVPRDDGRVLVGSTEEEAGFEKKTTPQAIEELVAFARQLVPALRDAVIERAWAGLRPGTFDGLPYLGTIPDLPNAFVAAGHFRSGLYLSPGTAVVMSQLLLGETPEIDLSPFRISRG